MAFRRLVTFRRGFGVVLLVVMGFEVWGQLPKLGLPGSLAKAVAVEPGVKVEVIGQYDKVLPGQRFSLAVVLEVAEGWHLYANPRRGELGKDTEIVAESVEGLRRGRVIYPEGEFYEDKELGESNYIYEGRVVCYVPVEVSEDGFAAARAVSGRMALTGLLCGDKGACVPWEDEVGFVVDVVPAGQAGRIEGYEGDLFVGVDVDSGFDSVGSEDTLAVGGDEGGDWLRPLLLAVGAGLLMNLMPCVLPVIPIIVLTLIQHSRAGDEALGPIARSRSLKLGLVFAAGILVVFAGLAVVMSVFQLLWGQQFQSNGFKFVLLMIVYVLGLSMFGLFEIALPSGLANVQVLRKGYLGTFGMGMLATVLATPCGAPLLGGVLTYSLSKPIGVTIAVFMVIGVGMALPYVVLTAFPGLLDRIPKAGNWMIRLKQALGFIMMGFAAYLLGLFPGSWVGPLLMFCVVVGFCVWLGLSLVNFSTPAGKRWLVRAIALVLLAVGSFGLAKSLAARHADGPAVHEGAWQEEMAVGFEAGQIVVVKFTANWCKNCQILDKTVFKTEAFQAKLSEVGGVLVVADWSYDDPTITEALRGYGYQGIPLAVIYPGGDRESAIFLSDFYTLETMLAALAKAAGQPAGL